MALLQKVKLHANERLDKPDFDNIQNFIVEDFNQLAKYCIAGESKIVSGFKAWKNAECTTSIFNSYSTPEIYIQLYDSINNLASVVVHTSAVSAIPYIFVGSSAVTSSKVTLTSGVTNYVELSLRTLLGSPDSRAFWDAQAEREFPATVDTVDYIDALITVNNVGFTGGDKIPLYEVHVGNTGSIDNCYDRRNFLFRLGTGTNVGNSFSWPAGQIEPSSDIRADINAFDGGDKAIKSFKDAFDAIYTEIKNLKGTPYWYGGSSGSIGDLYDRDYLMLTEGGTITWEKDALSGTLVWTDNFKIKDIFRYEYNIEKGSITGLLENECLYVKIPEINKITEDGTSIGELVVTDPSVFTVSNPRQEVRVGSATQGLTTGFVYSILGNKIVLYDASTGGSPVNLSSYKYAEGAWVQVVNLSVLKELRNQGDLKPSVNHSVNNEVYSLCYRTSDMIYFIGGGLQLSNHESGHLGEGTGSETLNYIGSTGNIDGIGVEEVGGSTTVVHATGLFTGVTVDHWLRMTSGQNKGLSRRINSVDSADQVTLLSAFPEANKINDSYEIYKPQDTDSQPDYSSHEIVRNGVDLTTGISMLDNESASFFNLCEVTQSVSPAASVQIKPSRFTDSKGITHYTWVIQNKASNFPASFAGAYNGGVSHNNMTTVTFTTSGSILVANITGADQFSNPAQSVGTINSLALNLYVAVAIGLDKFGALSFSMTGITYSSIANCLLEENIPQVGGKKIPLAVIALQNNGAGGFNTVYNLAIADRRTLFGLSGGVDKLYEEQVCLGSILAAGTYYTLPNDTRVPGSPAKYYEVGTGELEVYENGIKQLMTPALITPAFQPSSYTSGTGVVTVPDSTDLSLTSIDDIFVDALGNNYFILGGINNTNGSKKFTIATGMSVSLLSGAKIIRQSYAEFGTIGSSSSQIRLLKSFPANAVLTFKIAPIGGGSVSSAGGGGGGGGSGTLQAAYNAGNTIIAAGVPVSVSGIPIPLDVAGSISLTGLLKNGAGVEITPQVVRPISARGLWVTSSGDLNYFDGINDINLSKGVSLETWLNNSGNFIAKGSVVRLNGPDRVAAANGSIEITAGVAGIALEDIMPGASGAIQNYGIVPTGILVASNFIEGILPANNTRIYLSTTDGLMTVTPPATAGNAIVAIGLYNSNLILQISLVGIV